MKQESESGRSLGSEEALSPEVLRCVVGGTRVEEKRNIDGDMAAAMTAGMHEAGDHSAPPSSGQSPAHQAKADTSAKAGAPEATGAADKATAENKAPMSPDDVKNIEKHFRENAGTKLPELNQKNEAKRTYERTFDIHDDGTSAAKPGAAEKDTKGKNAAAQQSHQPDNAAPQQPAKTDYLKTAQQDAKTAFDTGMAKALEDSKKLTKDVKSAADTLGKAQDAHDLSAAKVKLAETKLKEAVVFGKGHDEANRGLVDELVKHERNTKALTEAKNVHDDVKQKHDNAQKAVENFKKALSKTDDAVPRKVATDDGTRPRANTAPASSGTSDDAHRAAPADKAPAPEKSKLGELKNEMTKEAWKTGTMAASKLLEDRAKQAAKDGGAYDEQKSSNVLAGGVTKDVTTDGNTTTEVTTLAQVKTEGETVTYSSDLGYGASASKTIRAEAGYESKVTHDLGNGASQTITDKAYAGATGEAKAKYGVTEAGVEAEAGAKVVVHAELRHTETTKVGDVQVSQTTYVEGHAEAGVKAGFHLGYDGVKVGVSASVNASVSAGTSGEVTVGDVKATGELKAFAEAMAEAKASAEVTFDPLKGTAKAKLDFGAMASAGIGVEGKAGLFDAESGSGVGAGGSLSVGAIGVKFKPDLDIKDGKLDLKVELGGALGIGGNVNFQVKGDLNKAKDNFVEATSFPWPNYVLFKTITGFFS